MANPDLPKSGDLWSDQEGKSSSGISGKHAECRICSNEEKREVHKDRHYQSNYWMKGCDQVPHMQRDGLWQNVCRIESESPHENESKPFLSKTRTKLDAMVDPLTAAMSETQLRRRNTKYQRRSKSPTSACELTIDAPPPPPLSPLSGHQDLIEWSPDLSSPEWSSLKSFSLTDSPVLSDDERYLSITGVGMGQCQTPVGEEEAKSNRTFTTIDASENDSGNPKVDQQTGPSSGLFSADGPHFFFDENGHLVSQENNSSPKTAVHKVLSSSVYEDAKSLALSSVKYDVLLSDPSSCDNIINDYLGSSPITKEEFWKNDDLYCTDDELLHTFSEYAQNAKHRKRLSRCVATKRMSMTPCQTVPGMEANPSSSNSNYGTVKSHSETVGDEYDSDFPSSEYEEITEDVHSSDSLTTFPRPSVNFAEASESSNTSKSGAEWLPFLSVRKCSQTESESESPLATVKNRSKKKNKFLRFFQLLGKRLRKKKKA